MTATSTCLELDIAGRIATITLSNPATSNAVSFQFMDEMIAALADVAARDEVRALVMASTNKVFSAGGDLDLLLEQHRSAAARERLAALSWRYFSALIGCPQPIVAAVQGDVIGGGMTLALCCDAIVCSRTAHLSDPHVVAALACGDGGPILWPQAVGLLRARRYLLTGDRIGAEEAHAMGLVTDLVDTPDEALPAALAIAGRIAALAPVAVRHTKKIFIDGLRPRIEAMFQSALALEMDTFTRDDVVEAVTAIRERRRPAFTGR